MSVQCVRCQSETQFRADVGGWTAGERFRVFECPNCGQVDWHPFATEAMTAKSQAAPNRRSSDRDGAVS